jgi:hypothetical protein
MENYTKFIKYREWCLEKGYCTKELYEASKRGNYSQEEVLKGLYSKGKMKFFKDTYHVSKEYHNMMLGMIRKEMNLYPKNSLIHKALTYIEDDYQESKH